MESVLCMAGSKNFKAIRAGATAFISTSISMATMEPGLERVTRLDGLDSLPSSLNRVARESKPVEPKIPLQTLRIQAAPFSLSRVIEIDSNQDLPACIPAQFLKRFLLILS